jgi:hypothetical protein
MLALFLKYYYELTKKRTGYKEEVKNKCKNYLEILKKRDNAEGQNYTKKILKNAAASVV